MLPRLTADDLRDISILAVRYRCKLLDAIAALGEADTAASGAVGVPALTVMFYDLVGSFRANGAAVLFPLYPIWLAKAQTLVGAPADRLRMLDEALTFNPDERVWRPGTLRVRGDIRRRQGEDEPAEADFRYAIALARGMSVEPPI